jgi:epoxyqueuosine reductase
MKEALRERAAKLGFDDCRITTAEPPQSAQEFQDWLAAGNHGEMAYLARNAHKRIEPQHVLPGARSIIALAASYEVEGPQSQANSQRPAGSGPLTTNNRPLTDGGTSHSTVHVSRFTAFIARYARFRDYHEVLGERLKQLADFVNQLGGPGTSSLWYVDTGPVLERDLAQRAGLGFIGKHTNLISRRLGNWLFLSEILTTLELPPDPPEKNHCGSCARCLAACPTGALTAPFELDARRCISYLTIELKGPIPAELRPAIGNRIYGCDDCLAVCPWNRFARAGQLMKSQSRSDLDSAGLLELLSIDYAGFNRRFSGSPISRAKRRGLLRNVCVALGNVGDEAALPGLEKATREPEPLIAEHARWAIDAIQARKVR